MIPLKKDDLSTDEVINNFRIYTYCTCPESKFHTYMQDNAIQLLGNWKEIIPESNQILHSYLEVLRTKELDFIDEEWWFAQLLPLFK
jgi:hypothetical protein